MSIKKITQLGFIMMIVGGVIYFIADLFRASDIDTDLKPSPPASMDW